MAAQAPRGQVPPAHGVPLPEGSPLIGITLVMVAVSVAALALDVAARRPRRSR